MRKLAIVFSLCLVAVFAVACNAPAAGPQATEIPQEIDGTPEEDEGDEDFTVIEPCYLIPNAEIPSYLRPHIESEVFFNLLSGDHLVVVAKTADGWIGFDPGIPQAANVGVFHHRWVQEGADFQLQGACENLPIVEGPPPGVCFMMSMIEIPVYQSPDPSSEILITMEDGDYAEAVSWTDDNWLELNLGVGTLGIDGTGWISGDYANLNGRCMAVTPPLAGGPPIPHMLPGDAVTITSIHMFTETSGWAIGGYDGNSDHILWTSDGGETWIDVSPPEPVGEAYVEGSVSAKAAFLGLDTAVVGYYQTAFYIEPQYLHVWTTQDGGVSWQSAGLSAGLDIDEHPQQFDFANPTDGWILMDGAAGVGHHSYGLFRTTDGGSYWEKINKPEDTLSICAKTGISFADALNGWMTENCPFDLGGGVFYDLTRDGGTTWEQKPLPPPSQDPDIFATALICHTHSPTLFSSLHGLMVVDCVESGTTGTIRTDYLYMTMDGGESWLTNTLPNGKIFFLDNHRGWALDRDIYWTEDAGETWTKVKTVSWYGQFSFVDPATGWAVARSGEEIALVKTTNGGSTWAMLEPVIGQGQVSSSDEPCTFTTEEEVTAYVRPFTTADEFGTVPTGMPFYVTARTADGWLGFDPGVAQAANIGVFRNRWVQDSMAIQLSGNCAAVAVVVGPPPGVCFFMPMMDAPVYASPDTSSAVLLTLEPEDYVKVEGKLNNDWFGVDLGIGNVGGSGSGWVEYFHANFNGPCWDLPTLTP